MNHPDHSGCTDTLLDLVCYEILSRRFSPEMEAELNRHLRQCPSCRRKVRFFRQLIAGDVPCRNFG